jgi:hypothetical protein
MLGTTSAPPVGNVPVLAAELDVGTDFTVLDWEYLLFVARKVD